MRSFRIRQIALLLVSLTVIGSLGVLGWHRMMAPIRVEFSSDWKTPIYAMIISSSRPESFVVSISEEGDFEDGNGYIKRGDVLVVCITDGESIYWEGRIELGHFGQVSIPLQLGSNHDLSRSLKDDLTNSIPWQAAMKKQNKAEMATPRKPSD